MAEDVLVTNQPKLLKWTALVVLAIVCLVGLCIAMLGMGRIGGAQVAIDPNRIPDMKHGMKLYTVSCATCHGAAGKGLPHQGAPLANSAFVTNSTDLQLILMLKIGRTQDDPKSVMKLPMPAKGGYSNLTDNDLHDVAAYIRTFDTKVATNQ